MSLGFEVARLVVPSVLVVIGWLVVARLQRLAYAKQETRKDLRTRLDQLDEDLRKLRDLCIEYYTDINKGAEVSTQIKVTVEDIRRQADLLSRYFLKDVERTKMLDCMIKLMNAATGGKFESRNRIALKSYDPQLTALFNYSAAFLEIFEDGFFTAYPPALPA